MRVDDVRIVGVVGAGVMGHGIAQVCARGGYEVVLVDVSAEILEKALKLIRSGPFGLDKLVQKGKMSEKEAEEVMGRIKPTSSILDLKEVDFLIEAVPEDASLKKKVFSEMDSVCKEEAVFASNTSGILISDLASSVKRKDRFIGMHWFNPAPVMKLIEVVRGALTSDETFKLTVELAERLGKTPIEAKDVPGFFTTRFICCWLMEAIRLLEAGVAGIREIDEMCRLAFGFPMGPFELMDLIGLDTMLHIGEYLYAETREERYTPPTSLKRLVVSGYFGDRRTKPGSIGGWYDFYKIERRKKE